LTELLAVIDAPHFYAGIVLRDDRVIEAAPIVRYMAKQRWTREVQAYCGEKLATEDQFRSDKRWPGKSPLSRQRRQRNGFDGTSYTISSGRQLVMCRPGKR